MCMRVLIAKYESEAKKGEILVPVRSPNGEVWLAGISTKCDATTAQVVDMAISDDDLYEFQGNCKLSEKDDISWMLEELKRYEIGQDVGMTDGKFYAITSSGTGQFWKFMLFTTLLNCLVAVVLMNTISTVIAIMMVAIVITYRHLR